MKEKERDRLVKLLGLLSSVHDGERAAAGLAADKLVRALGITWEDAIVGKLGYDEEWEDFAENILLYNWLTPWEREFCESLLEKRQGRELSEKQEAVINKLREKATQHGR